MLFSAPSAEVLRVLYVKSFHNAASAGISIHPSVVIKSIDMFARKVRVEYESNGERQPCPMKWLDNFSMRNFTNASVFDDTLPVSDGVMEIGAKVPLDALREAMEDWFRRKSYLTPQSKLQLTEYK